MSWHSTSRAAEPWLRVEAGASQCERGAVGLASRIEHLVAGERNRELVVSVSLREQGRSTAAEVRIDRHPGESATKVLVAPTCEEALEAVSAVVALALSAQKVESAPARFSKPVTDSTPSPRIPKRSLAVERQGSRPSVDAGVLPESPASEPRGWSARLSAGADLGTAPEPASLVGAGISTEVFGSELRGNVLYSPPTLREEASTTERETTRAEFAAVRMDLCRAVDAARWVRLCGGLEARVSRLARTEERVTGLRRDSTRFMPGLGAGPSALFVYPFARLQPELAVSMDLPLAGTPGLAERPIVRAWLGAALPL